MRYPFKGVIVQDDDAWLYRLFGYTVVAPADIRQALQDVPAGEDMILEINSPGGSVVAGFEMYSIIQASDIRTVAEVQSLSASASSVAMLGCDEVTASVVAQVMIHLPSTTTEGDRYAHLESVGVLDSLTESILNAYETKCAGHKTRDELREMMASATWMPVQDAVQAGLVDRVLHGESISPLDVVNAAGGILPPVSDLRARYAQMHPGRAPFVPQGRDQRDDENEKMPPVSGTPDEPPAAMGWREQARIDLAKIKTIF